MDYFIKYMIDDTIPDNPPIGKKFKWKASKYMMLAGQHLKSFSFLLLKCLQPSKVDYMLQEIHKRIYENHLGARSLADKALG